MVDLCRPCQLIWFDQLELLQLSPGATLELITSFVDETNAARLSLSAYLGCPRCGQQLEQVSDLQRGTRFTYAACPARHGRLLTFYQFLRAKNFVRHLSSSEINELRQHVKQANCSNCGAPVDLGGDVACRFCRTPVSILDPAQLRKTVLELQKAQEPKPLDPLLPLRLAGEQARIERLFSGSGESDSGFSLLDGDDSPWGDPLTGGLRVLKRLLTG